MHLTAEEQQWLQDYRSALAERYPGVVSRMVIYGSKARGDATPDSDLDILLIVKDEAGPLRRELRRLGHMLAAATPVAPSIMAYSEAEWEHQRTSRSHFLRTFLIRIRTYLCRQGMTAHELGNGFGDGLSE